MWRAASIDDDESVVAMCMALNAEDPGPAPVSPQQMRRTLAALREKPIRGRAVVCDVAGDAVGYALLISFWSNELGGEICTIDELFVLPEHRGRGLATALLERLAGGDRSLWPAEAAALTLEVSPGNQRARALYERLGFERRNLAMRRLLPK
ncbi:MAG TPA: GNAT family N-acetyltransferase [Candidatus Binataceae bacterium]|nr:GNAT family N-acetyltransferase [Candidatus Binataceae bacterium]